MGYPTLRDFYQKALVPIGLHDMSILSKNENEFDLPPSPTHWLIAIVGELVPKPNEFYYWRVNIYPSDVEGSFYWNEAIYSSEAVISFDWAIELARQYESISQKDQLFSANLQVKIS